MKPELKPELKLALIHRLTALADDEVILAHRNSEWTGHAPILEEDIALANLAQDELGHAGLWYGLVQALDGSDPDRLVYFREASAYRNVQMLELPKGDWAFTMLRQYLFDAYEALYLARACGSSYRAVAEVAEKIRREEAFHLRHSRAWVERLGLGTEASQRRLQRALMGLWPYARQLFVPLADETMLVEAGVVPDLAEVETQWLEHVGAQLAGANLTVPGGEARTMPRSEHSHHLAELLGDLQGVARADSEGVW